MPSLSRAAGASISAVAIVIGALSLTSTSTSAPPVRPLTLVTAQPVAEPPTTVVVTTVPPEPTTTVTTAPPPPVATQIQEPERVPEPAPDSALFSDGAARWGITCWNCGASGGSYIAINIDRIGRSDDTLRYVVAHETCHAIQDVTAGVTTEESADACASAHGAPPP